MTELLPPPPPDAVAGAFPPPPPPFPHGAGGATHVTEIVLAPTARRRSRRLIGAVAVVLAGLVVAGGVFAIRGTRTADGGSNTPDQAVAKLLTAAGKADMVGVLDSLEPAERDSLLQPLTDTLGHLKRLGVVSSSLSLSQIPGLSFSFDKMTYSTKKLGDSVSAVQITGGSVHTVGDWAKAPLGDFLVSDLLGGDRPTGTVDETTPITEPSASIVTVLRSGTWYVSLWYSVAEAARTATDAPTPNFGSGVAAKGSATPEAAVSDMLTALGDLDLHHVVELLPPRELAVLHDYAPLFLDDAQRSIDDLRSTTHLKISVDQVDAKASGSGNRRTVHVSAMSARMTVGDKQFSMSTTPDGCTTVTSPDGAGGSKDSKICSKDLGKSLDSLGSLGGPLAGLSTTFGNMAGRLSAANLGIDVVQEDGKWYVSPLRTITDELVALMGSVERSDLTDIKKSFTDLTSGGGLLGGLLGGGSGPTFTTPDEVIPAEPASTDVMEPDASATSVPSGT
jgi:hypothetical protein